MAGDSGVDSGRDSGVDSREHFLEAGVLGGVPAGDSGVSRAETPVFKGGDSGVLAPGRCGFISSSLYTSWQVLWQLP